MIIMIILMIALFGLIFGSFVNALVWRLRQQDEVAEARHSGRDPESSYKMSRSATTPASVISTEVERSPKKAKKISRQARNDNDTEAEDYSIVRGRSMCPHCHHTLAARDLVPVFSWLLLRGKCRYCKAPISWQYPLVELLTAVLFALSYVFWPYGSDTTGWMQFGVWLLFLVGFVALTAYDILWQELPDRIVWPLAVLALGQTVFLAVVKQDWHVLLWATLGVVVISGLFWLLFEVSKGRWIGFGDVKLGIVLGLLAGTPVSAMLVIFFASLLGTMASIPMLMKTKQKMQLHVPFGPFLIAGLVIIYFFGPQIIDWYLGLLY